MTDQAALKELLMDVVDDWFPADTSARDLGLERLCDDPGLPVIKHMYSAFCGSLDAAKALHEAVLPEWWWAKEPDGTFSVGHPEHHCSPFFGSSAIPARAWLIAILRALIAEG